LSELRTVSLLRHGRTCTVIAIISFYLWEKSTTRTKNSFQFWHRKDCFDSLILYLTITYDFLTIGLLQGSHSAEGRTSNGNRSKVWLS